MLLFAVWDRMGTKVEFGGRLAALGKEKTLVGLKGVLSLMLALQRLLSRD
jgi:hypothetical protein